MRTATGLVASTAPVMTWRYINDWIREKWKEREREITDREKEKETDKDTQTKTNIQRRPSHGVMRQKSSSFPLQWEITILGVGEAIVFLIPEKKFVKNIHRRS